MCSSDSGPRWKLFITLFLQILTCFLFQTFELGKPTFASLPTLSLFDPKIRSKFVGPVSKTDKGSKPAYILTRFEHPTRQPRRIALVSGISPRIICRRKNTSKDHLRFSNNGRARLEAVKNVSLTQCIFQLSSTDLVPSPIQLRYQGTLPNLPKPLELSIELSNPAHIYESVAHDKSDVIFGDNLWKCQMVRRRMVCPHPQRREGPYTTVLTALLAC